MLEYLELFIAPAMSFLLLMIAIGPLERAFPARLDQPIIRKAWLTDVSYFMGQYLLWNGLVSVVMVRLRGSFDLSELESLHAIVQTMPMWLQLITAVLISDLLVYWGHRLQHRTNFLWRFHKIHHSAEHLDWLAAHREHPLDTIYTATMINLPWIVMGFDTLTISGFLAFRGIWAIYIHSNIRINHGPLRWFIGAPELHHWHHDLERDRGNYSNLSPLMDLAFGTYTCPRHEPERLGIHERLPRHYVGQLIYPMIPARFLQRLKPLDDQAATEVVTSSM
jgi:sterol desaturase/sphingolipid hydroxylase (fatty acid hydroxylase superfamily)